MPRITIIGEAVLVGIGPVRTCGRTLEQVMIYQVGEVVPDGTLGTPDQLGIPLAQLPQLTLEQGLTVAHILTGGI